LKGWELQASTQKSGVYRGAASILLILELPSISFLRKPQKAGYINTNAVVYQQYVVRAQLQRRKQAINIKLIDYIKARGCCQQEILGN
jgi:hypothetical protein